MSRQNGRDYCRDRDGFADEEERVLFLDRRNRLVIADPPGIVVHDHVIVGKNGHASRKGLKLI